MLFKDFLSTIKSYKILKSKLFFFKAKKKFSKLINFFLPKKKYLCRIGNNLRISDPMKKHLFYHPSDGYTFVEIIS